MKNIYFFLVVLFIYSLSFGQTTIAIENYDGGSPNWNNVVFPATYNVSSDYWAIRSSNNNPSGTTGDFWAMRDLNNPNGGGNFDHTLTYDAIDITSYTGVTIAFDFYTIGYDNGDRIEYEIFYGPSGAEVGQGVIALNQNTGSWTTISENIPNTADSAYIVITARQNGGSDYAGIDNVKIEGTQITSDTRVEFTSTTNSVSEGIGTTDLNFSISNPDGSNATTFDVVLTSGDNADINSYTTQMVTFPAGSSTEETVTITVTDDLVFEGDEILTFEIQNVLGGNNAGVGVNNAFDLTIEENDTDPSISFWFEPFDNNNQYVITFGGEGNDGTQDYFQRTDGANINQSYSNINGDFFAGQDLDDGGWTGSDNPSQLTWTGINVSNYTSLSFKGSFASNGGGIDAADFVLVEYQIDSGGWNNLLAFENNGGTNTSFIEDTDFDGTGDGTALTTSFLEFSKSIGSSGTLLDIRITVSLDSGGEDIAFDDFKIAGIFSGLAYTDGSWVPSAPNGSTGASDAIVIDGTATFAADAALNDVNILPGAAVRVNSGVTLGTNTLGLKSTSSTFSSLIVDGTVTGTVAYERYVNSNDPINGNDLISAPLSGQNFNTFFGNNPNILSNPSGPEVLFGGFDNDDAVNPFELWNDTDTTPLVAGQGYRTGIDTAASANFVSFEGTVNASEVLVAIDQGTASILNLVGNPFPSYLDAQAFLSENAGVLDGSAQVIYGYNDSTDGTSSDDYTIISLLENTSVNIAPGQAFFVASNSTGGNIAFTTSSPDMRITSDQDDFIVGRNAAATITNVNISLTNASDNFITKVYFTPSSGLGLDPGYDASLIGGVAPGFALFSNLVEDNMNVPFATQALGKNDYNDTTVALGVNANMGEQLTFSIAQSTLPAEIEVYLDDTITSTSTLLNASDYIITPDSNLNGTGRFYLRFSNSALSLPENNLDNITIYTNPANRTINISGQIEAGTMAKIYDIQGRLVKTEVLSSNVTLHSIDGNALHAGVYIVELSHDNQRKSEKLILR